MSKRTEIFAETTERTGMCTPLNDALEDLRISGSVLLHESYASPWAIDIPAEPALRAAMQATPGTRWVPFHLVQSGAFDLSYDGQKPIRISEGEVAICPSGAPHRMSYGRRITAVPITEVLRRRPMRLATESRDRTELICGVFKLQSTPLNPLLAALPKVLRVRATGAGASPSLGHAVAMLAIEVANTPASFVASRLLEVFFAEAIREYGKAEGAAASGWFKALDDARIGLAISRIHEKPGAFWTVADLAGTIAMSPSRFAARFREVTGQSAMSYVSQWRMSIACQRLRTTDAPIDVIASEVGYRDVAAFSRAFKAHIGQSPARWRSSLATLTETSRARP